jgi:hypothetical protein
MSFNNCTVIHSNYSGDQIKKNEMGGACGMYGREEVHKEIWWGVLRERDRSEDVGLDRRIILKWTFNKSDWETWTWLVLAEGRDRWRALVNAVTNRRVLQNAGNFLTD